MTLELRQQILRAAVRDRNFLKATFRDIAPDSFPEREEQILAELAVEFYSKHEEPIGGLLRSYSEDKIQEYKLGAEAKKKVRDLVNLIQGTALEQVSVRALEERVHKLKHQSFFTNAVEAVISSHEKGELTADTLSQLVEKANRELSNGNVIATDYLTSLEDRITRRQLWAEEKRYPLSLIDALDSKIKLIGRGCLGMFLAPPKAGKSLALVHLTMSYALQGLRVLHFTLEDPKETVEDRLDAALTGLPLNRLNKLPNRLRKRFKEIKHQMHGRIKLIDATEGGWTVSRFIRHWEHERQNGFTSDVVVIDYDDEIQCSKQFKGDSARRFEFAEIYRELRQMASKLGIIVWTAAQASKQAEGKKIVGRKDVAEDYSKIRKVTLAIGIGSDPEQENIKHLWVAAHKLDRCNFGVSIVTDYNSAIFYDRASTIKLRGKI